jgi:pyruvate kinase
MTEKDKADMEWGVRSNQIDIVAASFVRKGADVRSVKAHLERCIQKAKADGVLSGRVIRPWIVSKIENKEGIDNFAEILHESDGIMVARGDLGVEVPFEELLILQKEMVRECNLAGKPVIVATQMLDSMQRNPRPTRAEVTDVGNAVLDGADCVMLSGESANGRYPVLAATTMNTIIKHADEALDLKKGYSNIGARRRELGKRISSNASSLESVCAAAVQMASQTSSDLIIAISRKGSTVSALAKYRPNVPIVAFVPSAQIGRRMVLHRAVYPIVMENVHGNDEHDRVVEAMRTAKQIGWLKPGHRVVVVDAEMWELETTQNMTKANCIKIFEA